MKNGKASMRLGYESDSKCLSQEELALLKEEARAHSDHVCMYEYHGNDMHYDPETQEVTDLFAEAESEKLCELVKDIADRRRVDHVLFDEDNKVTRPKKSSGRPPIKEVADRRDKVIELSNDGMRPGEIAAQLDIDIDTVKKDLKRAKS